MAPEQADFIFTTGLSDDFILLHYAASSTLSSDEHPATANMSLASVDIVLRNCTI